MRLGDRGLELTGVGCAKGFLGCTEGLKLGAAGCGPNPVEGDEASTAGSAVALRLLTRSCTSIGPFRATTE